MARLNSTEKLMQAAARKEELFNAKVFEMMLDFFKDFKYLKNDNNYDIIMYLYCRNHKNETFNCIAQNLCLSLSNLEERRKDYQKMFAYFYKKLKTPEKF